jgi:hypothetical protein
MAAIASSHGIELMSKSLILLVTLGLVASKASAAPPTAQIDEQHRAFLRNYCVACHRAEKTEGKLRLDDIPFVIDSVELADRWQKILNQLNSGEMPPEGEKQPDKTEKTEFLDTLARTLVTARKAIGDQGGKITMRRLNRREYKNTIRDLLGVEINVRELPADGGAGSFDTVGSALFMSSDQFEQYLALGRLALDEHFARFVAPSGAKPQLLHVEAEERNARIAKSLAERTDAHERYLKWTAMVDAAAQKPENAAVTAQIRAEKKNDDRHFYSQWQRIQGAPSPAELGFTDEIHADQQGRRNWVRSVPYQRAYLEHPATNTGAFLTIEDVFVNPYHPFRIPGGWPAGDYVVRVRIAATSNTPASRHFVEFGSQHNSGVRAVGSSHQVTGTMEKPQVLEIPLKFSPEKGHGFFFQEKGTYESEDVAHRLFAEGQKANGIGPEFALWIDWIEVESAASAAVAKTEASKPQKLRKDPEQWANKYMPIYAEGYLEKYSRFKKWCDAIDAAASKPENAEVAKRLREDPKVKQSPHLFYNRFAEIKDAPAPTQFGFRDVDDAQFARSEHAYHYRYYADYQKLPQRETGAYLMLYSLGRYTGITAPAVWPAGRYLLRVRLAATDEAPPERRFIEVGTGKADASDFNVRSSHQVIGTLADPQTLEIPVEINAGGDRNFAIRDKRPNNRSAEYAMFREAWDKTGTGPRPCIWVDFVELEGPLANTGLHPATQPLLERREVEEHANRMVGGTYNGYFKGGHEAAKAFLETGKPQKGIPDAQEAKFRIRAFEQSGPDFERYLSDPLTKTGAFLTIFNVHTEEVITLPPDQPSGWLKTKHAVEKVEPGEYKLRFCIGAVPGTPKERHFVALGSRKAGAEDFTLIHTFQINGTTDAPQIIEVPVNITADGPRTFVLRERRDVKLDRLLYDAAKKETGIGPRSALWIDWVEWEGPLGVKDANKIQPVLFGDTSGACDADHARAILEQFAVRAFRGWQPDPDYIDKLTKLFEARVKSGDAFVDAIKQPLSVVLASPRFLYLAEPAAEGRRRRLTDLELATRLAYFLWSAPPDDALLALARSGELQQADVLAAQIDRMIDDPKSHEFVAGFVHQWLDMDRLDFFQFNTQLYRDFDESTKAAARREVYLTFEHLLRHNESLRSLLKADFVIVNGLLAAYYGLAGVAGDEFRKVSLPEDSPRGGLLGMAAVLAMGSNGEQSSPVERGAWVLRKLLHDPPPPAPPNVPQITRLEGKLLTTRERLLAHQEEPQCASCHRKIDPIGFGLENFNAVGKWRTQDSYEKKGVGKKEWQIDPTGAFHKGPAFQNYFELRDLIAERADDFARGFTEDLIEYALGRPYGFADDELAAQIVARAKGKDLSVREFIHALVASETFHRK